MSAHWHIGMEVECIKDAIGKFGDLDFPLFRKGERYTIAGFDSHPDFEGVFLSFAECHPRKFGHESGFRPIVKRATDIGIFTAMLTDAQRKVDA